MSPSLRLAGAAVRKPKIKVAEDGINTQTRLKMSSTVRFFFPHTLAFFLLCTFLLNSHALFYYCHCYYYCFFFLSGDCHPSRFMLRFHAVIDLHVDTTAAYLSSHLHIYI